MQTVSRGELSALVELIKHALDDVEIDFVTDNKGVHDKFNGGPKAAQLSSNSDLFHKLFQLISNKCIRLSVRWMPFHLKPEDERPEGVSQLDVVGNSKADKFAGEAAKLV